ncbi:hypothetical protein CHAB381_1088 [Campylobacter hominis ATCC BAA-381]|uniref:Uncharacterized protein n=1 Tax=Campylobacter hominis (strain ATCC BAA-381 / DSM 21671 / CCUG 45161 / LMG 19568 / NCTC 13146 / CH001A) TaxID=360107 RepID=A7I2A6_CAMHC|nr:hypothetical protein CHAB381_1088 [Campylobacter hominis ATCC BAA-381]
MFLQVALKFSSFNPIYNKISLIYNFNDNRRFFPKSENISTTF